MMADPMQISNEIFGVVKNIELSMGEMDKIISISTHINEQIEILNSKLSELIHEKKILSDDYEKLGGDIRDLEGKG